VKVFFQDPTFIKLGFKIRIGKKDFVQTNYVDLGSQHTVTFFDDLRGLSGGTIEAFEIRRFGPLMRWQPDLQPQGANANFIQIEGDEAGDYIRIRTFERGVEAETLACGTGCMSAAIVAVLSNRIPSAPVRLKTQSGEFVVVGFDVQEGRITNLSLEGSAVRGLQGTFKFDAGVIASEAKQSVGIEQTANAVPSPSDCFSTSWFAMTFTSSLRAKRSNLSVSNKTRFAPRNDDLWAESQSLRAV
jgi:hypothetical protein